MHNLVKEFKKIAIYHKKRKRKNLKYAYKLISNLDETKYRILVELMYKHGYLPKYCLRYWNKEAYINDSIVKHNMPIKYSPAAAILNIQPIGLHIAAGC